jgi:hypothetical protein
MEAGLPSWPVLIERLLSTVASQRADLDTPALEREWVKVTLDRDDLLGAAAVVEAMANESLEVLIPAQLYGSDGASGYLPGPIAEQVANLREIFGKNLEILTTNYDDLIEQALIEAGIASSRIRSYCTDRSPKNRAANTIAVTHLHGLAGREDPPKSIVLTEEHYHRMQHGSSWQERLVTRRLESSLCLFVGMSMADPNLVRYLYTYKMSQARRHAAIFVRQAEPDCQPAVRPALEAAAAERWGRCGVEAIFVDHYADAAQLLYEIGYRQKAGNTYEPVGRRAEKTIGLAERGLAAQGDVEVFANRQVVFSSGLRKLLEALLAGATGGHAPLDESLALTLWLLSADGTGLTGWAHSDRAHQDPSTIAPVAISAASNWVAVRTVCQGVRVELDRDTYASRWRFVRGLPLILQGPGRLPIGCLTISSTKTGEESILTKMPSDRRAALHEAMTSAACKLIEALISIGEGNPPKAQS